MPDDDRFPRATGKGWKPATQDVIRRCAPDPPAGEPADSGPLGKRDPVIEAVRASLGKLEKRSEIPDFGDLAAEVHRVATRVDNGDDLDICAEFGTPIDAEGVKLVSQVARWLVATMSGQLVTMATREIALLLAKQYIRALARKAGIDRRVPFELPPGTPAARVLTHIRDRMDDQLIEDLANEIVDGVLGTEMKGNSGAA